MCRSEFVSLRMMSIGTHTHTRTQSQAMSLHSIALQNFTVLSICPLFAKHTEWKNTHRFLFDWTEPNRNQYRHYFHRSIFLLHLFVVVFISLARQKCSPLNVSVFDYCDDWFFPVHYIGYWANGETAHECSSIYCYAETWKKIESKITKRKYKYRQKFRLTFAQVYKTVWIF